MQDCNMFDSEFGCSYSEYKLIKYTIQNHPEEENSLQS